MNNNRAKILKNLSLVSYIGLVMVLPIFAGVYIGNILDQKLGTNHVFVILFIIIGVASSFLNVYKIIIKTIEKK